MFRRHLGPKKHDIQSGINRGLFVSYVGKVNKVSQYRQYAVRQFLIMAYPNKIYGYFFPRAEQQAKRGRGH
tara:strand:- start:1399 stop:1611 length:213 start_codon:yes stop_codon:yes gene_type:complete